MCEISPNLVTLVVDVDDDGDGDDDDAILNETNKKLFNFSGAWTKDCKSAKFELIWRKETFLCQESEEAAAAAASRSIKR